MLSDFLPSQKRRHQIWRFFCTRKTERGQKCNFGSCDWLWWLTATGEAMEVELWEGSSNTASLPMTPIPCSGWSLLGCPHLMQQALLAHSLLQCKIRCEDRWVERHREKDGERGRGKKVENKSWQVGWVGAGRGRPVVQGSLLAAKHRRVEDPHTKPCQCWEGKMEESWWKWNTGWDNMLMEERAGLEGSAMSSSLDPMFL